MTETLHKDSRQINFLPEKLIDVAPVPINNRWFEVDPLGIDQQIFQKRRSNKKEEKTRKLILEAFYELKMNPQKYGRKFRTMMPNRRGKLEVVEDFKMLAHKVGDHMADWVEQCLEWAQRIANGESWKSICQEADTANYYRLVIWKDGRVRLVGGSRIHSRECPGATDVGNNSYDSTDRVNAYTIPLVVDYDE